MFRYWRSRSSSVFGANAGAERKARDGKPAGVEESRLIVAARVLSKERAGIAIFDFIFVTRSRGAFAKSVGGLLADTCAIKLVDAREEWRIGIRVERTILEPADSVFPMRTGVKVPSQIHQKDFERFVLS